MDLFSQTIEKHETHIGHLLHEYLFKQKKIRWNGCLVPDNYFENDIVKIQQGRVVDLKEIDKHAC